MPTVDFGGIEIAYDDDALLAPRAWTIAQSRWAVELSGAVPLGPVLELCCGAGQIGLVVAVETGRPLVQVDDLDAACEHARRNAAAAGVDSEVRCAAVEDGVDDRERFPIVLADPPYVPTAETDRFAADPDHAIDGGDDGLDMARRCVTVARRAVMPGGIVLVQTRGERQARTLAAEAGFAASEVRSFGADRAVLLLRAGVGLRPVLPDHRPDVAALARRARVDEDGAVAALVDACAGAGTGVPPGELVVWAWVLDPTGQRILLVDHPRFGLLLPPGGRVEAGEDPVAAVLRELAEETGLVPLAVDPDPALVDRVRGQQEDGRPFQTFGMAFTMTADDRLPLVGEAGQDVAWHPLASPPARIAAHHWARLQRHRWA